MREPTGVVKAYDIRGVVDEELDERLVEVFGACFARLAQARAVVLGHDMRPSSPRLAEAFTRGVLGQGADLVHVGQVSTDMLYYASGALGLPGAMITASHNPPHCNGVKLCRAHAVPVGWETGLRSLRDMARRGLPPRSAVTGRLRHLTVLDDYRRHLLRLAGPMGGHRLRVVVDAQNGMAGLTAPAVLDGLVRELIPLNCHLNGRFPHEDADPMKPGRTDALRDEVRRTGADLGLVFDGDADRCVVVDETGRTVSPSALGALLAVRELARRPGSAVVHGAAVSRAVPETVTGHGGRPVRCRVGHTYVKQAMADAQAVLGIEHSAHYYFRDFWNADSGMLAALHVLATVSAEGGPVSRLARRHAPYAAAPETTVPADDPAERLAAVESAFAGRASHVDRLDGLTVHLPDGAWFNLRPANTENHGLLRLNVEAADASTATALHAEILTLTAASSRPSAADERLGRPTAAPGAAHRADSAATARPTAPSATADDRPAPARAAPGAAPAPAAARAGAADARGAADGRPAGLTDPTHTAGTPDTTPAVEFPVGGPRGRGTGHATGGAI
ncbi:phosphomannomutase/phosphoglucomutase [Streptomyces sp. NPDC052020]|uniref:phosphomannomutase/phosphoglucomutase n=1 Tax=Streptomyces sp. NPDC052020 TaxID=3155677 RepID=UPI00341F46ED